VIPTPSIADQHGGGPVPAGAEIAPGYEVIEHLRRGNDLDVYDAWSVRRMSRCVIKALRGDRLHKRLPRRALLREGALLERLSHPHIVRAYETIADPPLVVIETLPGATLSVLIDEEPNPAVEDVAQLALQLGSALHHLHSHGILHLDLKPSNVIAHAGAAKLIDLSLARPPGQAPAGIGTWHYLAPEQASGGDLGRAADVWGLGATLFEVVTGEAPFADDPDAEITAAADPAATYSEAEPERYPQLERPARRAEEVAPVEPRLADLIASCLQPAPEDRPGVVALLAAFEPLAGLPTAERRWSAARRGSDRIARGHA
jgi:serine/threonine protein kinase